MAFSEEVVRQAWERTGGQCECQKRTHSHFYTPCGKVLAWQKRGEEGSGGWEARQAVFGSDTLSNCEILCSACAGIRPFSTPV